MQESILFLIEWNRTDAIHRVSPRCIDQRTQENLTQWVIEK